MSHTLAGDVVQRHRGNPVIGLDSMPFRCSDIWNAGAIDQGDSVLRAKLVKFPAQTISIASP